MIEPKSSWLGIPSIAEVSHAEKKDNSCPFQLRFNSSCVIFSIDKHWPVSNISAVHQANNCAHILDNKYQEEGGPPTSGRNATLQGSTDVLARARAVKKESVPESGALKKKVMLLPAKPQVWKW